MPTNTRSKLLVKNVAASFLLKGWSAIVVLLMVPLTLRMLGVYNNGVWLTISSILIWVELMDIGLGNGLRNAVAENVAKGNHEKVREAISSTFFMLIVIILPILFLLHIIIWISDTYSFLGVDPHVTNHLKPILSIAITFASSTFILKAVGNFYMGLQLPAINNFVICLGQTTALLFTFIAYLFDSHSLFFVVTINTAAPFLTWAVSIPITFKKKYPQYAPAIKYINMQLARSLCSKGIQFFILQIGGIVLFTTSNVIICKLFSPAEVTPYQIASRYFNIAFVVFSTICMPFWSATTDAYTRKDITWMRKASRKLDLLMLAIAIAFIFMLGVSDIAYEIWIGYEVEIPRDLSASIAIYTFILCYSQRYSFILNGINVLRIQIVFTIIAATTFLPLAWYICKESHSVTSLVIVMCAVNTPGLIANIWKYHQVMHNVS